jgi:hypothetical protein
MKEWKDGVDVLPVPSQQLVGEMARRKDHGAQIDFISGLTDWLH